MEIDDERAMFIANEIGAAVIELIANGMEVSRQNIVDLSVTRSTKGF
ncbi:hypothetical protein [Serratia odorifera]|uniref:Uncharacterized protein n=1 Tax=Serratia odorifera DSM 4582 TaxID=667129 RepID=D4E5A3_SEROD|nr:hypothetical protein [Serratia odorifera]EFE94919.1 hypothetical protein HMPREF0758_3353 [Serratia odorifera DSM 4582]HEJ9094024.1 hypothetical protein [Serratia odorifera]HEJ9098267.1 hypothetical protein [Serratia odorifera]